MLHAVARHVWQVIGDKRISTVIEIRQLTKYVDLCGDDFLRLLEVGVDIVFDAIVMYDQPHRVGLTV